MCCGVGRVFDVLLYSNHMTHLVIELFQALKLQEGFSCYRLLWHCSQLSFCLFSSSPFLSAFPQMVWQRSELSCEQSSARRIWNSG